MISPWPMISIRLNGHTAEVKMTSSAKADSRWIGGVQSRPKPMVNSATPAMGMRPPALAWSA